MWKNTLNLSRIFIKLSFCIFLSLILLFSSFLSCLTVCASEIETPTYVGEISDDILWYLFSEKETFNKTAQKTLLNYILTSCGVFVDASSEEYENLYDFVWNIGCDLGIFKDDNTGVYVQSEIPSDILIEIRDMLKEHMETKEPYKIYSSNVNTVFDTTNVDLFGINSLYSNGTQEFKSSYLLFGSEFNNGCFTNNGQQFITLDYSKYKYAYIGGSVNSTRQYVMFCDSALLDAFPLAYVDVTTAEGNYLTCKSNEYSYETLQYSYTNNIQFVNYRRDSNNNLIECGMYLLDNTTPYIIGTNVTISYRPCWLPPIQIFNSYADLVAYVKHPSAYYTSNFYNSTYQDLTINNDTIKNYTTENYQNIYNIINNSDSSSLTVEDMQNIIDSTVSDALKEIENNTGEIIDNTNDISNKLDTVIDNQERGFGSMDVINSSVNAVDVTLTETNTKLDEIIEQLTSISESLNSDNVDTTAPPDSENVDITVDLQPVIDELQKLATHDDVAGTNEKLDSIILNLQGIAKNETLEITNQKLNEVITKLEEITKTNETLTKLYDKVSLIYNKESEFFEKTLTQQKTTNDSINNVFNKLVLMYDIENDFFTKTLNYQKDIKDEIIKIYDQIVLFYEIQGEFNGKALGLFEDIKGLLKDNKGLLADIKDYTKKINDKLNILVGMEVADLLVDIFGDKEESTNGLSSIASTFTAVDKMKTRFPFSFPWDIYALFSMVAHEPITPVFTVDIPILGLDMVYTLEIDLTGLEILSKVSRAFLTGTFCMWLYRLTYKILVK